EPSKVVRNFCTCKSILTENITAWFANSTKLDRQALQRVCSAESITLTELPDLQTFYYRWCWCDWWVSILSGAVVLVASFASEVSLGEASKGIQAVGGIREELHRWAPGNMDGLIDVLGHPAERLLSLGLEDRRKEYVCNHVTLDKIATWRRHDKS
ncbi:hypothetical protein NFI96_024848, partial [Prochilodus magdalenae]